MIWGQQDDDRESVFEPSRNGKTHVIRPHHDIISGRAGRTSRGSIMSDDNEDKSMVVSRMLQWFEWANRCSPSSVDIVESSE
ncbi:hypothetical protein OPQ81_002702 [Rhizoctonia solani]|nr:hypothetical protein OPQ81_002702 [Rhizoctonia solani]